MTATRTPWQGLNHLALVTADMDATVRFWHGVLGAELVGTLAEPTFRHYFFRVGVASSVAFFEYTGAEVPRVEKVAGVFDPRTPQFDHLSLDLPDDDALLALQQRLRDAGCEVTDVVDHLVVHSVYFTDPNGIALEASCWMIDPTTAPVDYAGPLFADPDPVPAVHELHETGRLRVAPARHAAFPDSRSGALPGGDVLEAVEDGVAAPRGAGATFTA